MRQHLTSISVPSGYYGASMYKWIQICEDNIVSSSSSVDKHKNTFWTLKMRTLLCLKMSGSECPWMQHHIPVV